MTSDSPQVPDTRLGNYYVSVRDGSRTALLAGPFVNDHASALEMVDHARDVAADLNPRAWFYAYGTCRLPLDSSPPGRINDWLVLPPVPPEEDC